MTFDILLLHPPSVLDHQTPSRFTGPLVSNVAVSSLFEMPPIGLLSIAEYIERNGYNTKVLNVAQSILRGNSILNQLKSLDALIYGIDLHWCVHTHGAIELASIIKLEHPDSLVVLGGLTASYFDIEILENYSFIDAVLKGEGEIPLLKLVQSQDLTSTPNLTYRNKRGQIHQTRFSTPPETLDEFVFTRLDLIEPRYESTGACLYLGRGCTFNCVTCGGSNFSCMNLLNRSSIAFRNPNKVVDDIHHLLEQGILEISLYMDARLGGKRYWRNLINGIRKESLDFMLNIELFYPAEKDFLDAVIKLPIYKKIGISPDSAVETVRHIQGHVYSNRELIHTIELCLLAETPIEVFFMVGLSEDTDTTVDQTLTFINKLLEMNKADKLIVKPGFGYMLLLDPGSLAYYFPERYGYKLLFQGLDDYRQALLQPHWKDYINYETKNMTKMQLIKTIYHVKETMLSLYEKHMVLTPDEADTLLARVKKDKEFIAIYNDMKTRIKRGS